jgi:multisubunit Na+/H+ antiporter MnhB subunit
MANITPVLSPAKPEAPRSPFSRAHEAPSRPAPAYDMAGGVLSPPAEPPFSKPRLELPEYRMLASLNRMNDAGDALMKVNMQGLDQADAKFKELNAENAQKLKEAAERMAQKDLWSTLKKIASGIIAAVSTVFGLALFATGGGGLVAGALIASGILSITNLAFIETGVWNYIAEKLAKDNKEQQEKLKILLPAIVGGLSAVVGLAGSAGAVLWAPINFTEAAIATGMTALNFADGVTTLGSSVTEYRSLRSQAELMEVEKKMALNQFQLEENASNFEKLMKMFSDANSRAAEIIRLSMENAKHMLIQG